MKVLGSQTLGSSLDRKLSVAAVTKEWEDDWAMTERTIHTPGSHSSLMWVLTSLDRPLGLASPAHGTGKLYSMAVCHCRSQALPPHGLSTGNNASMTGESRRWGDSVVVSLCPVLSQLTRSQLSRFTMLTVISKIGTSSMRGRLNSFWQMHCVSFLFCPQYMHLCFGQCQPLVIESNLNS